MDIWKKVDVYQSSLHNLLNKFIEAFAYFSLSLWMIAEISIINFSHLTCHFTNWVDTKVQHTLKVTAAKICCSTMALVLHQGGKPFRLTYQICLPHINLKICLHGTCQKSVNQVSLILLCKSNTISKSLSLLLSNIHLSRVRTEILKNWLHFCNLVAYCLWPTPGTWDWCFCKPSQACSWKCLPQQQNVIL